MIANLLYTVPVIMLLIIAACICYLCKLGFHRISFKGKFGPTYAEFTAERDVQHNQQVSKSFTDT